MRLYNSCSVAMFSKIIHHTVISFLVFRPVIFFENNSTEIWMSYAWFWCISNWLMCYFLFLICSSAAFNFVPFFVGSCVSYAKTLQPLGLWQWFVLHIQASFTSSEYHGVSSASCAQQECIFRNPQENTWFDPGMTRCPVPGLWGTSQLGMKPVLAVSRILVVFETGNPDWLKETVRELN